MVSRHSQDRDVPSPIRGLSKARQRSAWWIQHKLWLWKNWEPEHPFMARLWSFVLGITVVGWGTLLLTIIAFIFAVQFGWQEAGAIAVVGLVVLLIGIVWVAGYTSYNVEVDLAGERIVVGKIAMGKVTVINKAQRFVSASIIELPVGEAVAAFFVPRLRAAEEHSEVFAIPAKRRGVIAVGPVRSVRSDALGVMRRVQIWTGVTELYVHPRIVNLGQAATGFLRDIEGVVTRNLSSSDVAFHALRDYVSGDDRRYIHWKSTARTGKLLVRQFEETRRSHHLVVLDCGAQSYANEEEFETAVSVAASLGVQAAKDNRGISVVADSGVIAFTSSIRLLDEFTKVKLMSGPNNLVQIMQKACTSSSEASVMTLVTGSRLTAELTHKACSVMPINVVSTVLRITTNQSLERRRVGGVPVISLSTVDDLPQAISRVERGR